MSKTLTLALAAAGVSALFMGAADATAGRGGKRQLPTYGAARLKPPSGASDTNARGVLEAKHTPATSRRGTERSWIHIKVNKLDKGDYTVWMDDPSDQDTSTADTGASFSTNRRGNGRAGFDTKGGGSLPFGAALTDLVGKTVEIHDASDNVVLTGTFPRLR